MTLRCEECGCLTDDETRGWRALFGEEDDGELMVAVFCPNCAEREFGQRQLGTNAWGVGRRGAARHGS